MRCKGTTRLCVYKLLYSYLCRINSFLLYKVVAAANRFNPCTYCRANTVSIIEVDNDGGAFANKHLSFVVYPTEYKEKKVLAVPRCF